MRAWTALRRIGVHSPAESSELIVSSVGANPIPEDPVWIVFTERPVVEPHPSRPYLAHLFEADGRVPRIGLKKLEVLVGEFTNGRR